MTRPEPSFFEIPQSDWIAANRSAFAVWDGYPVTPGHALIVSRRQISDTRTTAGNRPTAVRTSPLILERTRKVPNSTR